MKRLISLSLSVLLLLALLTVPAGAIKSVTTYDPEDVLSPEYIEKHTPSSWAVDEINAARMAGLIPELTGNPGFQDSITREQFAELALQLVKVVYGESADMTQAKSFSDCTNPAVLEASAFGIVEGYGGNKFSPKNTTDRQQIATMLGRSITALKDLTGKDAAPKAGSVDQFSDKDAIASWAKSGVGLLAANGIMKGSGGRAMPTDPCTVEQSILMCYRIYQTFGAE